MTDAFKIATENYAKAEAAWQAELVRLFGKAAGDVRYTPRANGKPGTVLAVLYARYVEARGAWYVLRDNVMC